MSEAKDGVRHETAEDGPVSSADLPPTAQLILSTAKDILAERGYAELTMTAIAQVSGVNRALVSYYLAHVAHGARRLPETSALTLPAPPRGLATTAETRLLTGPV